ncbi:alcohol dehydrogenase catalytic domain-containing protein [Streptomyces longwoodensis]|uniref:alcohol dehydrogenase catalytic domain-containing protein n=1 Tax=Streptomyces longwoodensis TaxID=68231 RepID=UPI0038501D93
MITEERMRAVVARGYGGPEVLELVTVPLPEPGPGQIRICVEAATVNPVDLTTRSGALVEAGLMTAREHTGIGWDVAGVVDRLGVGVTGFSPGQQVIGLRDLLDVSLGPYSQYLVLDAAAVAPAPPGVSAVAAATMAGEAMARNVAGPSAALVAQGQIGKGHGPRQEPTDVLYWHTAPLHRSEPPPT